MIARQRRPHRIRALVRPARSHLMSLIWLSLIGGLGANAYAHALTPIFAQAEPIIVTAAQPAADADVHLLAATAWAEARSEGEVGMRAVAHVVVNRVGQTRFGDNLSDVILHPKQFSAWNLGDPNRPLALHPEAYAHSGLNHDTWITAQNVAREVLEGRSEDPTNGALFYHASSIRPYWAAAGTGRQVIGHHVFYADVRNARVDRVLAAKPAAPHAVEMADASAPPPSKK